MAAEAMTGVEEMKSDGLRESRSGAQDGDRPWRSHEKLALMHAVLKHGDQAWTAVSRAMRAHFSEERHQSIFSPRRCAEVHSELVDSDSKKLKRTGPVGDDVLKAVADKFAAERMKELKKSIKEKEKLTKTYSKEISMINAGKMDAHLQAIIDEPVPAFAQSAFSSQSPLEKKRSSKKNRTDSGVDTPKTPSAESAPTPSDTPQPLSSSSTNALRRSASPPKRSVPSPVAPLSSFSAAVDQASAPTPMEVTPTTPLRPQTPTPASAPTPSASFSAPSPATNLKLSSSTNAVPLSASQERLTPEEARRKQREPLLRVVSSMEKRGPHAQFFQEPVPLDDAPEYDEVIKQRMDFNQVRARIEAFTVYGVWEFYRDMLLIFTNALTYNEPGSLVYTVAGQMKRALEKEMEPLLTEVRGRGPSTTEEGKEGMTRRSARVKEERKWHDE